MSITEFFKHMCWWKKRPSNEPPVRVLINMLESMNMVGYLMSMDAAGYLLGETYLEREDGKYIKLPGTGSVFIPCHRVTLVQHLDQSFEMEVINVDPASGQK